MKINKLYSILIVVVLLAFTSCEKEDEMGDYNTDGKYLTELKSISNKSFFCLENTYSANVDFTIPEGVKLQYVKNMSTGDSVVATSNAFTFDRLKVKSGVGNENEFKLVYSRNGKIFSYYYKVNTSSVIESYALPSNFNDWDTLAGTLKTTFKNNIPSIPIANLAIDFSYKINRLGSVGNVPETSLGTKTSDQTIDFKQWATYNWKVGDTISYKGIAKAKDITTTEVKDWQKFVVVKKLIPSTETEVVFNDSNLVKDADLSFNVLAKKLVKSTSDTACFKLTLSGADRKLVFGANFSTAIGTTDLYNSTGYTDLHKLTYVNNSELVITEGNIIAFKYMHKTKKYYGVISIDKIYKMVVTVNGVTTNSSYVKLKYKTSEEIKK